MAEPVPLPTDDLHTRAAGRLADIRQRLAFYVLTKKQAEDLTLAEMAKILHHDKNMLHRLTHPSEYSDVQIGLMMEAMEWVGIGWADLEPAPERAAVLADISQKIMELAWPESKRLALRSATEHLWRVLEAM